MIVEYIKPFAAWLHMHPHWASIFAFFVAFTESLALIGAIVPGSVTLTALGVLIGSGVIPATGPMIMGILGAISGDLLSFWLGYHYQDSIRTMWPFSKHPHLLENGENFFKRHGKKSVFWGRFVGPIRSVLPLVAGMMNMPPKRFIFTDILSGILWAPTYMLPGIIIGAASLELDPEIASRMIVMILGLLLAIWIISWLIKITIVWHVKILDRGLDRLWQAIRRHPSVRPITVMLQNPSKPHGHGQMSLGLFALLCGMALIILIISVINNGWVTNLNQPLYHFFRSLRGPVLDHIAVAITFISEVKVMLPALGIVILWLCYKGYWRSARYCLFNAVLCTGIAWLCKHGVDYPRPTGIMVIRPTSSFPSGHTTLMVGLGSFYTLLLSKSLDRYKRHTLILSCVIAILSVILTRMYLGAHWFSDILGGLLVGLFSFSISTVAYRRKLISTIPFWGLLASLLLATAGFWGIQFARNYQQQIYNYTPYWQQRGIKYQTWWQQHKPILPVMRHNRLGHPSGVLNIQWAATLPGIKKQLEKQGWQLIDKSNLQQIIQRLVATNRSQHLPVFNKLYRGNKPVLIVKKSLGDQQPIAILRLWDSRYNFSNSNTPLWIGTINYRILWHHKWLQNHHASITLPPPLSLLKIDPEKYKRKQVIYHGPADRPLNIRLISEK